LAPGSRSYGIAAMEKLALKLDADDPEVALGTRRP